MIPRSASVLTGLHLRSRDSRRYATVVQTFPNEWIVVGMSRESHPERNRRVFSPVLMNRFSCARKTSEGAVATATRWVETGTKPRGSK